MRKNPPLKPTPAESNPSLKPTPAESNPDLKLNPSPNLNPASNLNSALKPTLSPKPNLSKPTPSPKPTPDLKLNPPPKPNPATKPTPPPEPNPNLKPTPSSFKLNPAPATKNPSVPTPLKKFLFVGSRFLILDFMLKNKFNVLALIPHRISPPKLSIKPISFCSKEELIALIQKSDFDILISNGCPFILPISKLKKPHQIFVNLHPSLLPSLKGAHPINGAILFSQPTGATCHIMDDKVDHGDIIAQVPIKQSLNINLKLLYQMCFLAELEAFKKALKKNFKATSLKHKTNESSFYRTKESMLIKLETMQEQEILKITQAFCINNQYAKIRFKHHLIPIYEAKLIQNAFLKKQFKNTPLNEIVLSYEDCILIARHQGFLELKIPRRYRPILRPRINLAEKINLYQTAPYIQVTKKSDERLFRFSYQKGSFVFKNIAIKSQIGASPYFDLSSPYGFGGYFTNTPDRSFIQEALIAQSKEAQRQNIIAEFIRFHPLYPFSSAFADFLHFFLTEREIIEVQSDFKMRWDHYSSRIRGKIRKAINELCISQSQDIATFHQLYIQTMQRSQAKEFYFFDLEYFKKLFKLKNHILLEAKYQDTTCAMGLFFYDEYCGYYHFGANSHSSIATNLNPMCAIFETFFQIAQSKGIKSCILGGGRSSSPQDSLLLFKKQFSPISKPFYIGGNIYNQEIYQELCKPFKNPYFLKYRFPLEG